jgi:hypothetical protein
VRRFATRRTLHPAASPCRQDPRAPLRSRPARRRPGRPLLVTTRAPPRRTRAAPTTRARRRSRRTASTTSARTPPTRRRSTAPCTGAWRAAPAATSYSPGATVTRGRWRRFVARLVERSGGTLPAPSRSWFGDDDTSPHRDSIDRLAEAASWAGRARAPSRQARR